VDSDWRLIDFYLAYLQHGISSQDTSVATLLFTRASGGFEYSSHAAMASPAELPAMNEPFKNPKFIFFTDFDGTITLKDSNDFMVCIKARTLKLQD
jgi:hypothetical protein